MYFNDRQQKVIGETIKKGGYVNIVCKQGSFTNSGCGDEWVIFREKINNNNINDLPYITHLTATNYLFECLEVVKSNAKEFNKSYGGYIVTTLSIELYNVNEDLIQCNNFDYDDVVDVDYYYY